MKSLALRIYLAVVAVLLLFALATGWLAHRNLEAERARFQSQGAAQERLQAWAELMQNSLPAASEPEAVQRQALLEWAERLRAPMALQSADGRQIAVSRQLTELLVRRPELKDRLGRVAMGDGRVLVLVKFGPFGGPRIKGPDGGPGGLFAGGPPPPDAPSREGALVGPGGGDRGPGAPWWARGWPGGPWFDGQNLLIMLVVLFVAVALGAWPVATHLTRRLQALRQGVERFGSGQLHHRVAVQGKDEVADLARSFNEAAQRIEELVAAHRTLLANASHEFRSPLARMKMAVSLLAEVPAERATRLQAEIHEDIAELDGLVEEVLLASRLDARPQLDHQPIDVLGLLAEEAQRTGAQLMDSAALAGLTARGDERLLRRAVRNLLENARRYGRPAGQSDGPWVEVWARRAGDDRLEIGVDDRGPGVPEGQRERIFEPFYRLPGHAEHAGGVGLGLSLVRQIAQRHGGSVRCEARDGGGSRFVIAVPLQAVATP